ncbi:MAG: hypothetical protein ABIN96_01640 [Rubrivivax sp.]
MSLNKLTRLLWLSAALLLIALAVDVGLLWRDQNRNALIEAGTPPNESTVPQLRFARAYQLAHTQPPATGGVRPGVGEPTDDTHEAALKAYRGLQTDPTLGAAARFNSANLLLRQAFELQATQAPAQAPAQALPQTLPLIELAKEQYRELLRHDPQHWPARYNLERAQRLLPDPPDSEAPEAAAPRERERAATKARAQSLGLP